MSASHSAPDPFEAWIRRDPARRGLLGADGDDLCAGHLAAASDHLARFGTSVWILTGFFVPGATPPAAETDGPPGAALLGAALAACGMRVTLLTDTHCLPAVQCAARLYGLDPESVCAFPENPPSAAEWAQALWRDRGPISHLISIERVGPAHHPDDWGEGPLADTFRQAVPAGHWGRCHNMRGEIIDSVTPPLHALVEWVAVHAPAVKTIGIGDGGNEIGMGAIPWQTLRQRLTEPQASQIPCRIATDWTILAGVSNWGGMALAATVCHQLNRAHFLKEIDVSREERRLNDLVRQGPAVDGVTRVPEATVDGLPFLTYIQPWEAIRRWLRLDG